MVKNSIEINPIPTNNTDRPANYFLVTGFDLKSQLIY